MPAKIGGALRKLGWFVGIWAASVAALGVVSLIIKYWLR